MVQLTTSYTGHYISHRAYEWWVPRQLTPELKGRDMDTCLLSCLSLQICGHGLFKWRLWHGTFYFEHHPYAWCRDEHIIPYCNFVWWWISVGWLLSLTKQWIMEYCFSFVLACNIASAFVCSADSVKSTLPDLPYTVSASNPSAAA